MFLVNSRLGLFSAAFRHSFSRSYGVFLPSSLMRVLPLVFGFSPRLPVSVSGTGTSILDSNFSWQPLRNFAFRLPFTALMSFGTSLKALFVAAWTCSTNRTLFLSRCVLASLMTDFGGTGFITGCPSPTLSPRLRSRLTLGGLSFPRKP